jgi:hypothetical protein
MQNIIILRDIEVPACVRQKCTGIDLLASDFLRFFDRIFGIVPTAWYLIFVWFFLNLFVFVFGGGIFRFLLVFESVIHILVKYNPSHIIGRVAL